MHYFKVCFFVFRSVVNYSLEKRKQKYKQTINLISHMKVNVDVSNLFNF